MKISLSAGAAGALLAFSLGWAQTVCATTVEVLSVQNAGVTVRIDGRPPRTLYTGDLTPEGVYVLALTRNAEARLRIRGEEETLTAGRVFVAAPNVTGLPALNIPKDVEGRFVSQFLLLNQPFQVEIDPKSPLGLVLPAADADRVQLPYKDPPSPKGEEKKPRKSEYARPTKHFLKGKPYLEHHTAAKSIRVGAIELFGVKTTVSENPELKRAVAGRAFLTQMDATWEGNTLTLRRLP